MKAYKNVTIEVLELEEDVVRTSNEASDPLNDKDEIVDASDFH